MPAKSEKLLQATGEGEILDRNITSYLESDDPEYLEKALESLTSVVRGALLTAGYELRIVRHLLISFGGEVPIPDEPFLEQVRLDLAREFGASVAAKISLDLRPLTETYPEDTRDDLKEIRCCWKGHVGFKVPLVKGSWDYRWLDFEGMYDLKSMHRKGDIGDDELILMRIHNQEIYDFLVNLGWSPPDHINPDNLD